MILSGNDATAIKAAASCIRAGELLGLPTETVYGLAADADNDAAVAQIFTAKGRPADHPLIVHVANATAVDHYACDVPDFARALMAAFWPGPLTLILPRRAGVANAAAGGNPTVGLRCPSHPVAQALLHALLDGGAAPIDGGQTININGGHINGGQIPINSTGFDSDGKELESDPHLHDPHLHRVWGLAAPSANQFGRVSPTTAAHVQGEFGDALLILDGGPCSVGIESSIIDCSRGQPVLLRPGAVTPDQVQLVCGLKVLQKEELATQAQQAPKASGTLESHYAPRARVRLMDAQQLQQALDGFFTQAAEQAGPPRLAIWSRTEVSTPAGRVGCQFICQTMPTDPASAAHQLFATLRALDAQGVDDIWVETPPDAADWDGVRDRLQRAAH